MQYRNFGKLNIKASAFGLGCMRFPMKEVNGEMVIDEENAIRVVREAIDGGVTYVDTAYVYSGKKNEALVGKALRDGYRERVYLATKLPVYLCEKPEDMEKFLDEQLKNLETDHIDFYLLHALNRERWESIKAMGACEFLDEMKRKGKIRYACFSFHDEYPVFEEILNAYDWDMCQIQFNYMDIENQAGLKGLRLAGEKNIPVVIMEGLLGGKLANAPDNVLAVFDEYKEKRSAAEWAFRYLCDFPKIATVLSGVVNPEQTADNLRIFDLAKPNAMSEEEMRLIDRAREAYLSRIKVGCTGCAYCMPCPMGVNIPKIFKLYNEDSLYGAMSGAKSGYKRLLKNGEGADRCVACRKCEKVCPQGFPIPEFLKAAHEALS